MEPITHVLRSVAPLQRSVATFLMDCVLSSYLDHTTGLLFRYGWNSHTGTEKDKALNLKGLTETMKNRVVWLEVRDTV